MSKKHLFIILLFTSTFCFCQILNVENLRRKNDSSRFSGGVSLNFYLSKNINTFFNLTNNITLQYKTGKHLIFFVNNIVLSEVNTDRFVDISVQHLRYNFHIKPILTYEVFTQFQKDNVSSINLRSLFGTGPRFQLLRSKKNNIFLGTLIMHEHENSVGSSGDVIDKATRGNVYLSLNLNFNKRISFTSTTYYQPKLDELTDYRVSSETSFSITLLKNLALTTSFSYQFDQFPVLGIPNSQYKLENGIQYTF